MKAIFQRIRDIALPYQDKRDDAGHHAITLAYARELVRREKGNEDIVIPAIILHDTGWSRLSKERIAVLFNEKSTKEQISSLRFQHQNESVKLAAVILNDIGYPPEWNKEILRIILEHDTRDGFISKNEGLVRDADKLWRFSKVGFETDVRRFGISSKTHCGRLEKELNTPKYLYSTSAMRIAKEELNLRRLSS